MICPNCKKENKKENIKCEFCLTQLIDVNKHNYQESFISNDETEENQEFIVPTKKVNCLRKIITLIFVGPWLLIGLLFLGVGLFSSISEHYKTKEYKQATAILKDYKNCTNENGSEFCEAIYEYQINGVTYSVSPSRLSERDDFSEKDTVYYNPKNPSEAIMYAGWNSLAIWGFIMVAIAIIVLIFKDKFTTITSKNEVEIIYDNESF